ncbi:MAG: hypothetical protein PSX37_02450 [bacterium]|nr:hypothetical protein [bacterium]
MVLAALFGALSASTLLVGALLAYAMRPSPRLTAIIMALGSGLLIGSVSYDLVADAQVSVPIAGVAISMLAGAAVFVVGSRIIDTRVGQRGKGDKDSGVSSPLPIVLGTVLDGIPESFVLGLSVLSGAVSVPLFVGIGLSNLPEGLAGSAGLRTQGWPRGRVLAMWGLVVATSAAAAAVGHQVLANDDGTWSGIAQTFAAGALLAMIADTMVPDSYAVEREWTGGLVVAGFALSLLIAAVLA